MRTSTDIPKDSELFKAAEKLRDAAIEYREAYKKSFRSSEAVIWMKCDDGFTVAFTRGEYHERLIGFLEGLER